MKLRIKLKDRTQLESKRKDCEREGGEFCYMHPVKDPPASKPRPIEPVQIKKESNMIKKPATKDILRMNEKEIESVLNSDETSDLLRAEMMEKLSDLESDPRAYREAFSEAGSAAKFIRECIDSIS